MLLRLCLLPGLHRSASCGPALLLGGREGELHLALLLGSFHCVCRCRDHLPEGLVEGIVQPAQGNGGLGLSAAAASLAMQVTHHREGSWKALYSLHRGMGVGNLRIGLVCSSSEPGHADDSGLAGLVEGLGFGVYADDSGLAELMERGPQMAKQHACRAS